MPPKNPTRRVSLAPGTKTEDGGKETKTRRSSIFEDNPNPIKRTGEIKRAGDLRRQRDTYANHVREEKAEQERELRELRETIEYYRKDNEKLLRLQKTKYGMHIDDIKYLRSELDQARESNDVLFQEVETRKEECDKLQGEMEKIVNRINELVIECNDFQREKKIYMQQKEQIDVLDIRAASITKSNRELRAILVKNKINPNSDSATMGPPHGSSSDKPTVFPPIYDRQTILRSVRSMNDMTKLKKQHRRPTIKRSKTQGQQSKSRDLTYRRHSENWPRIKPMEIFL